MINVHWPSDCPHIWQHPSRLSTASLILRQRLVLPPFQALDINANHAFANEPKLHCKSCLDTCVDIAQCPIDHPIAIKVSILWITHLSKTKVFSIWIDCINTPIAFFCYQCVKAFHLFANLQFLNVHKALDNQCFEKPVLMTGLASLNIVRPCREFSASYPPQRLSSRE
jgi:hypothetical protein